MIRPVLRTLLLAGLAGLAPACAHAADPTSPSAAADESETAEAPDVPVAQTAEGTAAAVGSPPEPATESTEVSEWAVGPGGTRSSIGLDSLLRPRGELSIEPRDEVLDRRGGRDRASWYNQYQEALGEVDQLKEAVDATQAQMRRASGGSLTYSPVGAADTHDPEVVKFRARLKRDRQSLDTAHSRLREIEVEASLGEVPDSWLHEAPPGS